MQHISALAGLNLHTVICQSYPHPAREKNILFVIKKAKCPLVIITEEKVMLTTEKVICKDEEGSQEKQDDDKLKVLC